MLLFGISVSWDAGAYLLVIGCLFGLLNLVFIGLYGGKHEMDNTHVNLRCPHFRDETWLLIAMVPLLFAAVISTFVCHVCVLVEYVVLSLVLH